MLPCRLSVVAMIILFKCNINVNRNSLNVVVLFYELTASAGGKSNVVYISTCR